VNLQIEYRSRVADTAVRGTDGGNQGRDRRRAGQRRRGENLIRDNQVFFQDSSTKRLLDWRPCGLSVSSALLSASWAATSPLATPRRMRRRRRLSSNDTLCLQVRFILAPRGSNPGAGFLISYGWTTQRCY